MREITLFAEDTAHERVMGALLERLAAEHEVEIWIRPRSVRGGHGKVIAELRQYIRDLRQDREALPDLLVVATDANCKGIVKREREIDQAVQLYRDITIGAVPDPHVGRWLLLDSGAFKAVVGKGCAAPDKKCARHRYKRLLIDAVEAAGRRPLLGGLEYAEDLVRAMNLEHVTDASFDRLLKALRATFREWQQPGQLPAFD